MDRAKEGESGEKHMYHGLEKPGDDAYEDPDKNLEENTAIEYENPVPQKEIWLKHTSMIKICNWNHENSVFYSHVNEKLQLTYSSCTTYILHSHVCIKTALSITPYSKDTCSSL